MMNDDKIRTEATFVSNTEVGRLAGKTDVKRDGVVKDISIALYDVDYAVKWHIENIIQPTITEQNAVITVPILFAAGEKWAAVQKHGYLRDNQGKLLTPLIMIKRNSVSRRDDIQDLKVLETAESRIVFEKKYSTENRYDRFSLTQRPKAKEYYSMDVPKYMQVEYDLMIWTNNITQLNEIVEQLIWFDGKAFGDTYKFITHIDPPSFDTVNSTGEDRLVRATMLMRTKAYILNTHGPNAPSLYKLNPVNRLVITTEVDTTIETVTTQMGHNNIVINTTVPVLSPSTVNTNTAIREAITYVNTNKQNTGNYVNSTTIQFNSGWLVAPSSLPATSVDNFIFYANGTLIERTAIVSFTTNGSISTLVVDKDRLGFEFVNTDEIVGIGKFLLGDS